jgi:hypothetical protein
MSVGLRKVSYPRGVTEVVRMSRVIPPATGKHLAAVVEVGPEALELMVPDNLEGETDREEQESEKVEHRRSGRQRGPNITSGLQARV